MSNELITLLGLRSFCASIGANLPKIFDPNISANKKAHILASLAKESLTKDNFERGRDGIKYLANNLDVSIETPLSRAYEAAILEMAGDVSDLNVARMHLFINVNYSDLPSNVYQKAQIVFQIISGEPWIYWISDKFREIYGDFPTLETVAEPKQGLATADNFRFLRLWWESGKSRIRFVKRESIDGDRWYPCLKGGSEKRWYGNQEYIINWKGGGKELKAFDRSVIRNPTYNFREGITWSLISSGKPSFRWIRPGWIITHKGPGIYSSNVSTLITVIAVLNSSFASLLLKTISSTIGYEIGQLAKLPFPNSIIPNPERVFDLLHSSLWIKLLNETSMDFIVPLSWKNGLPELANAEFNGKQRQRMTKLYIIYTVFLRKNA